MFTTGMGTGRTGRGRTSRSFPRMSIRATTGRLSPPRFALVAHAEWSWKSARGGGGSDLRCSARTSVLRVGGKSRRGRTTRNSFGWSNKREPGRWPGDWACPTPQSGSGFAGLNPSAGGGAALRMAESTGRTRRLFPGTTLAWGRWNLRDHQKAQGPGRVSAASSALLPVVVRRWRSRVALQRAAEGLPAAR